MFEATLAAADPDRPRIERLGLATLLALASTTAVLAGMSTLDRMHIDRITGPASQRFELTQVRLLPPPKVVEPPPPRTVPEQSAGAVAAPRGTTREESLEEDDDDLAPARSSTGRRGVSAGQGDTDCRGPACGKLSIPGLTGIGSCVGPHCSNTGQPGLEGPPSAKVEYSAMTCRVCPDPDKTALRKLAGKIRQRSGTVAVRFCVDTGGLVEARSIQIDSSFDESAIDEITRAAIRRWRFAPMKVNGAPRRACSRVEFDFRFD
jgi:TonB family protein